MTIRYALPGALQSYLSSTAVHPGTSNDVPVSSSYPRGLHRPNHPVRPSLHHGIHRRGSATGDAHLPVRRIMPVSPAPCRLTIDGTARDVTGGWIGRPDRHVGSVPQTIRTTATKGGNTRQPRMSDDTTSDAGPATRVRGANRQPDNPASPITPIIAAPTAAPTMTTKGLVEMQIHPASTRLRDIWDAAMADHRIDAKEADTISVLIEDIDDGTRLALTVLKGGRETRRACDGLEEYEELHGPIDFEGYKNARTAEHDPDAA